MKQAASPFPSGGPEKTVIIVGGGFVGLNAARRLGDKPGIRVILIDKRNHHLFQPLLYQVAMAGLSPADIAEPIRSLLRNHKNIWILQDTVHRVDGGQKKVVCERGEFPYDFLILSCGASLSYYNHPEWEEHAPGLKTVEHSTEIRRRVLAVFEQAEMEPDPEKKKELMTFVIVGGGPTGVELAGAIGEMSRFTLSRDFKNIDPTHAKIYIIESGSRILPSFPERLSEKAAGVLKGLGVEIWNNCRATGIYSSKVEVGDRVIRAGTALWAAGVKAVELSFNEKVERDHSGRIYVNKFLQLPGYPEIFVAGDQAHVKDEEGNPLPGVAPVAMQQGRYLAHCILEKSNDPKASLRPFRYRDKGQLATIGRKSAVAHFKKFSFSGWFAWWIWLIVHIYYLTGFRNKFFVLMNWTWSYVTFKRGARLILLKEWSSTKNWK